MTATLTFRGRLPGVACDPALPEVEAPVRLDVAGFVGFAERGPLDVPVAVEGPLDYAAVFGGEVELARDGRRIVHAQLPSAVRSFFDNGGRRCYVVRVAGKNAKAGRWQLPGLRAWSATGTTKQLAVEAAWPGTWSQGTVLATWLESAPLKASGSYRTPWTGGPGSLALHPTAAVGVQRGDLLRIELANGQQRYVRVAGVDRASGLVTTAEDTVIKAATATAPETPKPRTVPATQAQRTVAAVHLYRFGLVVSKRTEDADRVLERHDDLAFGPGTGPRPYWLDVLQSSDDLQPDRSRSMILRQLATSVTLASERLVVPVGMGLEPMPAALATGKDGLDSFDLSRFADDELLADSIFSLVPHADQLTSLAAPGQGRRLRGLHALLQVDEVALVAVPDAGHRTWSPVPAPAPDPVSGDPGVLTPVDWSRFACCEQEAPTVPAPTKPLGPTTPDSLYELDPVVGYDLAALHELQVALVTMCAATQDRVALLSVPAHLDPEGYQAWRSRLQLDRRVRDAASGVAPLSFAAAWHPWVTVASHGTLRDVPPDGVVAGLIAHRELERGAWIASAGVPLRGVVDRSSLTDAEEQQLFGAHANLVVRRPGTFTTLSAHTLSDDPALLQLNVRRLLILLRKICLRLGDRYVFEVNNDRFRQLVRMRFDRILGRLVERGALHAFRVVTDGAVNTAADQDAGRFVVALQVAPTSPVEFITVTLVRTGEGLLDVLEA